MIDPSLVQGDHELELKFVDDRIFLNYWDSIHGNDVCVQIIDGKLMMFVYSPKEVEQAEVDGAEIEVFKQRELTVDQFVEAVKESIVHGKK